MTDKLDVKKVLDSYHARRGEFRIIEMPRMQYLMVDGDGDPNEAPEFAEAIEALYPVAYALKFASKREIGRDYVVPPLEGLWWADDMAAFTRERSKSQWSWTLMIMVPDSIERDLFHAAREQAEAKSPARGCRGVRLEPLDEGTVVQTLHLGSFDDEAPVLARLHDEVIPEHGFEMAGKHHEIYLSDFRKVAPDKQRTILRQPYARSRRPPQPIPAQADRVAATRARKQPHDQSQQRGLGLGAGSCPHLHVGAGGGTSALDGVVLHPATRRDTPSLGQSVSTRTIGLTPEFPSNLRRVAPSVSTAPPEPLQRPSDGPCFCQRSGLRFPHLVLTRL